LAHDLRRLTNRSKPRVGGFTVKLPKAPNP
jgi:hypothetical protein